MIQLKTESPNTPPLLVNPAHVASVEPRRSLRPDTASQTPQLINEWTGALVRMSDGQQHRVMETYEEVSALLGREDIADEPRADAQLPKPKEVLPEPTAIIKTGDLPKMVIEEPKPWIPSEPEPELVVKEADELPVKPPAKKTQAKTTTPAEGTKEEPTP